MAAGLPARHAGVDVGRRAGEADGLAGAGGEDAGADDGGRLPRGGVGELGVGQGGDLEVEIDAVEQGAREAGQVAGALRGRAGAGLQGRAAAAAGIGGGDELEAGGEAGGARGAGDDDAGVLERLPQGLQDALGELGQLVEEQHAVMGEADLAGMRNAAAADEAGLGRGVVRAAERPRGEQALLRRQQAGDAPDRGDLDGFLERERRQDGRQPPGQHRLAGAGRPDHQHVVRTGGGDLEGALGVRVAPHVGEIEAVALALPTGPTGAEGRADVPLAIQVLHRVVQGGDGNDVDAFHHAGLRGIRGGHENGREALPPRVQGHRQHAAHRAHAAVERQLAHHERALQPAGLDQPGGAEDADRDRQVEGGAFLADIGGRQVDGDAVDRELEARVADGGADPVAALAHGRVGEADGVEGGQPRGDVHLHEDGGGLDPAERGGANAREHGPSVGTAAGPPSMSRKRYVRSPDIC